MIILQRLKEKTKKIFSNGFIKSVSILIGGTIFSQALMILVLPILTRLYSPKEFGILALYASLLLILSIASSLRLEISIPIIKKEYDAIYTVVLALICVTIFSLIIALFIFLFSDKILNLINRKDFIPYSWLLPMGIFSTGSYMVLQYWATRKKEFKLLAKTKVRQAISSVSIQLSIGYFWGGALGLLLGHLMSGVAGLTSLFIYFISTSHQHLKKIDIAKVKKILYLNKNKIKYTTLEAFFNTAGLQLPIILIVTFSASAEAGFLFLATRLMAIPITLIGHATAQVFLADAATKHKNNELANFTKKTIIGLSKTGIGPLIFLGIISPFVIPIIFGPEWYRAGALIGWMVPWFVMQFITSPVSMVLHVTQNQRKAFLLQFSGLILRVGAVSIACFFITDYISEIYAISGFIFYFLFFCIVIKTVKCSLLDIFINIAKSMKFALIWILLGIVIVFIFKILKTY